WGAGGLEEDSGALRRRARTGGVDRTHLRGAPGRAHRAGPRVRRLASRVQSNPHPSRTPVALLMDVGRRRRFRRMMHMHHTVPMLPSAQWSETARQEGATAMRTLIGRRDVLTLGALTTASSVLGPLGSPRLVDASDAPGAPSGTERSLGTNRMLEAWQEV